MNKVVKVLAEVSVFAWSIKVLEFLLGELDSSTALLSFLLYVFLRASSSVKIPAATLSVDKASGDFYEVVEWSEGISVVKVKLGSSGLIEVYLALTTIVFLVLSVTVAVGAALKLGACYYPELALLYAISTLFYRFNSNYLRNVGISVSAIPALLYATIISTYMVHSFGKDLGLTLALALNSSSILVGCDLLMVKYAILGSRSITIGGLGVYDAIVIIPSLSCLATLLLA